MKKTWMLILSVMMIASFLFSACQTQTTPQASVPTQPTIDDPGSNLPEPVTLTFVNWIGAEDATIPALDAMLKGFTDKYPHITVENVPFPFNQSKDQLLVMSTGGTPPDVSMSHPVWNGPLVEAGVLEPLNNLVPNLDKWPASSLEGWTFDGNIMAVTWTPSPVIVYYNKNLLTQAGYNEPPKTWDEMMQMARDVAGLGQDDQGNQIYGLGISSKKLAGAGYFALPFMHAYGGEFIDNQGDIVLDTPENLKAFQEMKALFDEGVSPEGLEIRDLRNLFATGTMGFHWDIEAGISIFAGLSEKGADFAEDYGMIVMPGSSAAIGGRTILLEHNLVIYKDSPHKHEAALLIDYLTGPEGISIYNEHGGNKLPIRTDTAGIEFYNRPENVVMQIFVEQLPNAHSLPAHSSAFLGGMEELASAIQQISVNNENPTVVVPQLHQLVKGLYNQ